MITFSIILIIALSVPILISRSSDVLILIHRCGLVDTNAIFLIAFGIIMSSYFENYESLNGVIIFKLVLLIIFNYISGVLITSKIANNALKEKI